MIPYLCPEMRETQKAALHKVVKTPLVYTTVALRNWRAFHKLGIAGVTAPGQLPHLVQPQLAGGHRRLIGPSARPTSRSSST